VGGINGTRTISLGPRRRKNPKAAKRGDKRVSIGSGNTDRKSTLKAIDHHGKHLENRDEKPKKERVREGPSEEKSDVREGEKLHNVRGVSGKKKSPSRASGGGEPQPGGRIKGGKGTNGFRSKS